MKKITDTRPVRIQDLIQLGLPLGLLIFCIEWCHVAIQKDPRNLLGLNSYRYVIALLPALGIVVSAYYLTRTIRRMSGQGTQKRREP